MDNLHFGQVFHLPTIFLCSSMVTMIYYYGKGNSSSIILVHLVFFVGYCNFFWEKACRTLGINRLL